MIHLIYLAFFTQFTFASSVSIEKVYNVPALHCTNSSVRLQEGILKEFYLLGDQRPTPLNRFPELRFEVGQPSSTVLRAFFYGGTQSVFKPQAVLTLGRGKSGRISVSHQEASESFEFVIDLPDRNDGFEFPSARTTGLGVGGEQHFTCTKADMGLPGGGMSGGN